MSSLMNLSEAAVVVIYSIGTFIGMVFRDYYCKGLSFKRTANKKLSFIVILIAYTVVVSINSYFSTSDTSQALHYLYELFAFFVTTFILLRIYKTSFLEICAHMICTQLCCNIFTYIYYFFLAKINGITFGKTYMVIPHNLIALLILIAISIISFLPGTFIYNSRAFQKVKKIIGSLYILGFAANGILVTISNTDEAETSSVLFVWILVLSFTAIVAILKTGYDNKRLNADIEMQSAYYEKYASNQEIIRRMNHDIKNHMHTISYMLKDSDNLQAINYANELEKEYSAVRTSFSENKILDAVFTLKYNEAVENGIEAEFVSHVDNNLKISNKDMSALLSNLLDNAIEACKRNENAQNIITASVSKQKDNLFIKVSNTFNEEEKSKKSKFFSTFKDDKFSHGLGMKIVKSIVAKYKGSVKTSNDNGLFSVVVVIAD